VTRKLAKRWVKAIEQDRGCPSLCLLVFLIRMQLRLQEVPLLTQGLKALEVEVIFMVSVRITYCFIQARGKDIFINREQCINHLISSYMKRGNYTRGSRPWEKSSPGAASVPVRAR